MTEFPEGMAENGGVEAIAKALRERFGEDAKVVAGFQVSAATGEHRMMWNAVVALLSDQT